jgi:hypothetical protein
MNIKVNKKENKKIVKQVNKDEHFEYTEMTVKLNEWLQKTKEQYDLIKCSKIHKPLKSTCFTPSNEMNRYCENDSIVFKPFPARWYKKSKK